MNSAAYSYRTTFNLLVERSIEKREIVSGLFGACKRVGEDFNEVVEHISAEIAANN